MKLITKEIEKRLEKYPLYSQDGKKGNANVICKFFKRGWTWYVLEARKEGNDYLFFGIVDGFEREYGYFTLSQLQSVCVERDLYFKPIKVSELN